MSSLLILANIFLMQIISQVPTPNLLSHNGRFHFWLVSCCHFKLGMLKTWSLLSAAQIAPSQMAYFCWWLSSGSWALLMAPSASLSASLLHQQVLTEWRLGSGLVSGLEDPGWVCWALFLERHSIQREERYRWIALHTAYLRSGSVPVSPKGPREKPVAAKVQSGSKHLG